MSLLGGEVIAQGVGRTKKDAEQDAAKAALALLKKNVQVPDVQE